ncbi:hypothetical protein OROGR_005570 [Orobanche gracilis]
MVNNYIHTSISNSTLTLVEFVIVQTVWNHLVRVNYVNIPIFIVYSYNIVSPIWAKLCNFSLPITIRWSKIVARLPGRTDNEIKNHWNTHIKKKLLKMGIDPFTHQPLLKETHQTDHQNSQSQAAEISPESGKDNDQAVQLPPMSNNTVHENSYSPTDQNSSSSSDESNLPDSNLYENDPLITSLFEDDLPQVHFPWEFPSGGIVSMDFARLLGKKVAVGCGIVKISAFMTLVTSV